MSYITTINKQDYRIEPGAGDAEQQVTLDGRALQVDWQEIAPLAAVGSGPASEGGRYTLLLNGRSYEVFARRLSKPEERESRTYEIMLAGQSFEVRVEDERSKLLAGLVRSNTSTSEARVQAPMPGMVLNMLVEVGQAVTEGQAVAVLEAMKMENDLPTPIEGTVKEVRVSKGQTVEQGQVLVVVEGDVG